MANLSLADLEIAALQTASVDPGKQYLSLSDLRDVAYSNRQTPYASDPATNRSAIDVEMETRRTASVNPNKQYMSLADLRREVWGG